MYADRYAPRRVNAGGLGLSVGIVAPLLAAAMLTSTLVTHPHRDPGLRIYPVLPPPPPPRPEPTLRPKVATPVPPVPTPLPPIPLEPKAPVVAVPDLPIPTIGSGTPAGGGTDAGTATVDPVRPAPPVLTGAEVDGRYARDLPPNYPPAEQRAGRDGLVTLKVLIGTDGRVRDVEQLAATSDAFWEATRKQALGRWRFRPATKDGAPVEAWKTMTVRFRLEDAGL